MMYLYACIPGCIIYIENEIIKGETDNDKVNV